MKATFNEWPGSFEILLEAESVEEVILFARFGINKTKEIRSQHSYFNQNGTASLSVVIGKRKESNNYL